MSPLLPALATVVFLSLGAAGLRLMRDPGPAGRLVEDRFEDQDPGTDALNRSARWLGERLGPRVLGLMREPGREKVRHRLDVAGRPGGMTLDGYARRKAVSTAVGVGAGVLFVPLGAPLLLFPLAALGWTWVDLRLGAQGRRRQTQIDRDLPDFLDVLSVSVSAGVGFRAALQRVAETTGGPAGEEVLTTLRQMDLGTDRRQAFESMRTRNESEFLALFVTAFLQAEELGVPLTAALESLAEDMRSEAGQRARRRALRAAPRISVIVTIFIVPASLLLIVAGLIAGSSLGGGLGD